MNQTQNAATALPRLRGKRINRRIQTIMILICLIAVIAGIYLAGLLIDDVLLEPNFSQKGQAPSPTHPFGTDMLGRDMLVRTVKGLSLSIAVGTIASTVAAVIAVFVGITAASGLKALDHFVNWVIDLVMSVPHMVLLILISFVCGRGLTGVLIGISLTHWTSLARVIRAEVLQVRSQPYIAVSKKMGKANSWIMVHHILPHVFPQFLVGLILMFPHAIMHESGLTFLGFGLSPEQPAIGIILSESMKYLSTGMWWLAFFPGLMLVILVLMFDKLGESVRTLVDPYSAQE